VHYLSSQRAALSVRQVEPRGPADRVVELLGRPAELAFGLARTSSPRSTSCRVPWEPTKSLAPITSFFAPEMG
jgi:hypothetical protein